jgi:hypothetical protein
MMWFRLILIIISLILISEIPSSESVFFKARLAFYGMLLLDYINLFKSNKGFEKHFSGFGLTITGLICLIDCFGLFNFIELKNNMLSPNSKYILMSWFPKISLTHYIVSLSFVTIFLSAGDIVLKLIRYSFKDSKQQAKNKDSKHQEKDKDSKQQAKEAVDF